MALKNAKAKGNRNERRSRDLLIADGYTVTKAGGSLGMWDLIGIGRTDFVLVQVKSNRWPGRQEVEGLVRFQCPANCRKTLHRWDNGKRVPQVKLLPHGGQDD